MKLPELLFIPGYLPLFTVSSLSAGIFLLIIVAMVFVISRFYRSNIASYQNNINAMASQIKDMQQHLDYASREETKARADAKRAAAARDKLLISLSHEIRTPMNGILGMAVLLEETELNPEQRDYMETIISSGKILLNKVDEVMANDMLEQSKIDRSINSAQQKNTDLRNCLEDVFDTFAVKASEKAIELLYEIAEDVPQQVLTDNKRLKQVLTNLVENLMEANQRQQVFIGVQVIRHDSTDIPPVLGFTIGPDPVGNASKTAKLLATGDTLPPEGNALDQQDVKTLGLSISKKLVEEMSGQIREIRGNTYSFIFSIPLHGVEATIQSTNGYNLKDFEGKPVLIVNSNITAAAILKSQLQQWKLNPTLVTSADQALLIAAEKIFSLVITDMNLRGMNGAELAASIKETYPQLPIILLNPLTDERYKVQNEIMGAVTILSKPVKRHTLFDNILSNLQQNKIAGQMQDMSARNLSADFAQQYPMRILVAEDNPVNQKWATKILEKLGYEVDIAGNGHVVLDMVDKASYDLILMDVQMPEMDGLEATKMIRLCLSKQPTIIAMTANVMHGDRLACMQAGMDDYISKPVQLGELVNMLEKWALVITEKKLI